MNFLSSCYLLGLEPDTEFTKDSRSIQLGAQSPWTKPSPPQRGSGSVKATRLWGPIGVTRIFPGIRTGPFEVPPSGSWHWGRPRMAPQRHLGRCLLSLGSVFVGSCC